jgi:glycosyltransferase involved in cell wall biosynthesis
VADPAPRGTVVVLGSYGPSLILFRRALLVELVRRGYRVVAMAPGIPDDIRTEIQALGAEAREVPLVNASLNPLAAAASLKALAAEFRSLAPDALIAYTIKPVTLGSLAAARAGVPRIVALITGLGFAFTEGGGFKRRLSKAMATILYRRALRRCTSVIFQNPDDRTFFEARRIVPPGPHVAVVNGSGIDLERFQVAPLPAATSFLMISRYLGDKGVREYGEAVRRLKPLHPDVAFRLVGYPDPSPDGIPAAEMAAIAEAGVELVGRLDDVRPAVAAAGVYVLPSYREGTPRSVLEALAMGRPVITTDAPGCRETVEHGVNGLLVPPRDAQALAAAMERLIREPALLPGMAQASRALAERKFEVGGVTRSILAAAGL